MERHGGGGGGRVGGGQSYPQHTERSFPISKTNQPMKKTTTLLNYGTLLTALIAAFLVTACDPGTTSPAPKPAPAKGKPAPQKEDGSRPPRMGMTKEEVRARYGRPMNVSMSSRGETWSYLFNAIEGQDFIPFYGAVHNAVRKRHGGAIIFGADGRVKDYTWNVSDPGAAMFR